MILKQRFADGRTAYTDIGDQWLYIQKPAGEFKDLVKDFTRSPELEKDCIGLIEYGERKMEPIYIDFPQWVYSNHGQLFMTLTRPVTSSKSKSVEELHEEIEADTEKNMNLISAFIDHVKKESDNRVIIPEEIVLSFFKA